MVNLYKCDRNKFRETYLNKSKEPFQFLSSFLSLYSHKFYGKEIKTPILFDATCSGIQHLSALSKNIEIGKLVNLFNNEEGRLNDFYTFAIDKVLESIDKMPHTDLKTKLLKLKFIRS